MKTSEAAILVILLFLPYTAYANDQPPTTSGSPDLVVHLLDYLAKDYGGAIQNGEVVSASEYAEQIEFVQIVEQNAKGTLTLDSNQTFMSGISQLVSLINSKGQAEEVATAARKLQLLAIQLAAIEVAPRTLPDLQHGAELYQNNCVSCHGINGDGNGIAGANLDPKPANFLETELAWNSSPYKFYNTIRFGVPGTGMAPFTHFSDDEVWDLAFYLKSLPYNGTDIKSNETAAFTLKEISSLTDAEIANRLSGSNSERVAAIGSIRRNANRSNNSDPTLIAERLLDESLAAAKTNNFDAAKKLALRAYLEGIEPIEPKMKANIPEFVEQIESQMGAFRALIENQAPIREIEVQKSQVFSTLAEVRVRFSQSKMSPSIAFGAAFAIFIREGFEAILLIIVLLSLLKAMGQTNAIKWVHFGWMAAIAVGGLAWIASGALLSMSGLSREVLEGSISILAVAILAYVGIWLHRYSEAKKWKAFLESKLKHGLSTGSYAVLALVSFMAVFREAFEVVLFLRAIWIDLDPYGQKVAGRGVISAFIFLSVISFYTIRASRKLPIDLLFKVCSWTMVALGIILAGKGVHSLQEAGIIPISTLPLPIRLDLLGIYPSIQTLLTQAAFIAFIAIMLLIENRKPQPATP